MQVPLMISTAVLALSIPFVSPPTKAAIGNLESGFSSSCAPENG